MKVNCSIEIDANEINATTNGVKDLLNFIVTQIEQDEIKRRLAGMEGSFRAEKVSKWWNEDEKDSCKTKK